MLLGVLGGGVFLAGLELMVTAVALPSIVNDLGSWTELRQASWVINGYLLAYVITMPLAGRLADQWGVRRLFLVGLGVFTLGSLLAGLAPSLETLIGARVVQAVGGGILVPVGTAAAAHLFGDVARPRALGVIGALTFLGMAAGPFVGAWIIGGIHPAAALDGAGILDGPLRTALESSWRYVFYVNVPIGIAALGLAWAAAHAWETPRVAGRLDILGALAFSIALGFGLVAVTLAGSEAIGGFAQDPALVLGGLLVAALAAGVIAALIGLRHPAPFLDVAAFPLGVLLFGGPRVPPYRLRPRDGDRGRRRLRRPGPVRRARCPADDPRGARRGGGRRGPRLGASPCASSASAS